MPFTPAQLPLKALSVFAKRRFYFASAPAIQSNYKSRIANRQTVMTKTKKSVRRIPVVVMAMLISSVLLRTSTANQNAFPFDALVVDESDIRSGPSQSFYATNTLERGTKVSVYQITQDGWCAIRPLEKSFSWIRRDQVATTDRNDVVRVISPQTFSRVGSHHSEIRNVRSVDLEVGDLLAVMDARSLSGKWVKIQPPAGEFRWIHQKQLRRVTAKTKEKDEKSIERSDENSDATLSAPSLLTKGIIDLDPPAAIKGKMTTEPIPVEPDPEPNRETVIAQLEKPQQDTVFSVTGWVANTDATNDREIALADPAPQPKLKKVASVDFGEQLSRINAELSKIVAKDQQSWDFSPVQQKAKAIVDFANDETHRKAARKLLRRIHEFEAVKLNVAEVDSQRNDETLAEASRASKRLRRDGGVQRASFEVIEPSEHERRAAQQRIPRYHQFDGYGWLMPVYSTRRGLPKFALTNRQGTILAFVSPNAGMNLRPYLKKRVGLIGRREARPIQQKPHLSVARVVVLDRKSR